MSAQTDDLASTEHADHLDAGTWVDGCGECEAERAEAGDGPPPDPAPPPGGAFRLADQQYDPAIPVHDLREHPLNPNQGDEGAVTESLREHGFYGAVLVQRSTGLILAGHTRWRAASREGATTLPGFWLDVDDDTAVRILAVDNRTARLGTDDQAVLADLLRGLAASERGLSGTGYDGDDLDSLISDLADPLPPGEFPTYDDDLPTEYECPSCHYRWSGNAQPPSQGKE